MPDVVAARYKRKGDELWAYCHYPACGRSGALGKFGIAYGTDGMYFWLPEHFMLTADCVWVRADRARSHQGARPGDCGRTLDLTNAADRKIADEVLAKTPLGEYIGQRPDGQVFITRRVVPVSRLPIRVICPGEGRHINLIEASAVAQLHAHSADSSDG